MGSILWSNSDLVHSTRPAWCRPGRREHLRRLNSKDPPVNRRGPVPSSSSPRTGGRPCPATYHSASSSRASVQPLWRSTLEPSLSPPFPVQTPTAVRGEPWQRQRHPSFPGRPTKIELRPQPAYWSPPGRIVLSPGIPKIEFLDAPDLSPATTPLRRSSSS